MLRILTILMTVAVLTLSGAPVLKTGQTTVYAEYDDGYYQTGALRSYSRSGDVVSDNATGLEWQDNENITKTWSDAISYCSDLLLDGGGWRLPSIEELETLLDNERYDPAVTEGIFNHISWTYLISEYSTSTIDALDNDYAWSVSFRGGGSSGYKKAVSIYVRCVRSEPMESTHTFSRNDATEIVSDETTGLQWQDDAVVKTTTMNWTSAIDYCENTLVLGGYTDWRLPNKNEMLSIDDRSRYDPAIDDRVFINTASNSFWSSYYWSSTTIASNSDYAWVVYFYYGHPYAHAKTDSSYVRCVRGGQFDDFAPPLPAIIMYLLN